MLAAFLVSVTVILLAFRQQTHRSALSFPGRPASPVGRRVVPCLVPATVGGYNQRATSGPENIFSISSLVHAAARISKPAGPESSREARRRGRDPLRHHRATVGRGAKTPWYVPIRSLILLVLVVIGIGMAIAGITLLIIGSGRFVLEILAG